MQQLAAIFDLDDKLGSHPMHPIEDERRAEAAGAQRRCIQWHLGRSKRLQGCHSRFSSALLM